MKKKKTVVIANLIDWSESFVDENGSFYCGTTDEQKRNAAEILKIAHLVVSSMDLHPLDAPEFAVNGGLYPVHNVVSPESLGPESQPLKLGDKSAGPRLTRILRDSLVNRCAGIVAPRSVYFQGAGEKPFCSPRDIERTFAHGLISETAFLNGNFEYIIAPKKYFDATRVDSNLVTPPGTFPGIPDENYNIYSLLKLKYPAATHRLVMINTGVVEGICRLHSSIGMKQMFPDARLINISDATTALYGVGLGYRTKEESRNASMQVCRDVGIEYMTTEQCLQEEWENGGRS
jgi:hypothetical protein